MEQSFKHVLVDKWDFDILISARVTVVNQYLLDWIRLGYRGTDQVFFINDFDRAMALIESYKEVADPLTIKNALHRLSMIKMNYKEILKEYEKRENSNGTVI